MPGGLAAQPPDPAGAAPRLRSFGLATLGLMLCFAWPLWSLIGFAARSQFYSYILLIPFISFYLVWQGRKNPSPAAPPAEGLTAGFLTAGALVLAAYWLLLRSRWKLTEDDYLAVMMPAFLLFFAGICGRFLGGAFLRAHVFPLGLLVFMVPMPTAALQGVDMFLQYSSAAVACAFFTVSGTSFLQDGLVFQLPDITLQIAPECSGIHSSLVLFITSLLAAHLFLHTPWKRAVFILAVIPLGILRNGFRVYTIGELCIHIGPRMINSPIHHKGGPIFFALSLIPLFLLLIVLQKSERSRVKPTTKPEGRPN
jgi:exosortase C (VPDSG-CTERM-specific)